MVRNSKPKRILCVGSRKGFVPAILALACKDNGMGHVDFVDAGYDQDSHDKHWSGIGFWKKTDVSEHFKNIGVHAYITTHVMTTKEYANKTPKKTYQYIYIDGDHSYKGVKLDYSLFWPRLAKYGYMTFHDIVAKGYLDEGLFGVWRFWKEGV
jgi:predicted O-methyltransferase YrrM